MSGRQPDDELVNAMLRVLSGVRAAMEQVSAVEYDTVQLVRAAGASWELIGDALGISRQAAMSRFNKPRQRRL